MGSLTYTSIKILGCYTRGYHFEHDSNCHERFFYIINKFSCLSANIVMFECDSGTKEEVTTLKPTIIEMRRDVDHPKSTDMSLILGMVEFPMC